MWKISCNRLLWQAEVGWLMCLSHLSHPTLSTAISVNLAIRSKLSHPAIYCNYEFFQNHWSLLYSISPKVSEFSWEFNVSGWACLPLFPDPGKKLLFFASGDLIVFRYASKRQCCSRKLHWKTQINICIAALLSFFSFLRTILLYRLSHILSLLKRLLIGFL